MLKALFFFLLFLQSPAFALKFDFAKKTCVEGEAPLQQVSPLRPCFTGKLTTLNFEETQKIKSFETLYLQGAVVDFSQLRSQKIRTVYFDYSSLKQSLILHSIFEHTSFEGADLRGARIQFAKFLNFNFRRADFRGVKVYQSVFRGGDLSGGRFSDSLFTDSSFEDCFYDQAFLKEATLINVTFKNCREVHD